MRGSSNGVRSVWLSLLLMAFPGGPALAQDVTTDPDLVRLEVGDVRRLADAMRSLSRDGMGDTTALIEGVYLASASPGLRAYAGNYNVTAASIASAAATQPSRFGDLDALADSLLAQQDALRSAFARLREGFPGAVFPPIWFIVGDNGPGGLTRPEGVIIAVERLVGRAEDVVPLVLHELAHFQQAMVQGVERYRNLYGPEQTLLGLALREGTAELIAELTTGRHINPSAEGYGRAHERTLWQQFRRDMLRREPGDWMFVRPANAEWPPDLGYWVGYRIARRYYDRAADKKKAVHDLLDMSDYQAILDESGYGVEFEDRDGGG